MNKSFTAAKFCLIAVFFCSVAMADVTATSIPSLWDTAWILPLTGQQTIDSYLEARAQKGFDVVMTGITDWNMRNTVLGNGQKPFADYNVDAFGGWMADVLSPNEAGFAYIDHIIQKANSLGLTIGLLPMSNGGPAKYVPAIQDAYSGENRAYRYGLYLGARYKNYANLIWILGGDVCPGDDPAIAGLTRSLAQGIIAGGGSQPMTYHPSQMDNATNPCSGGSSQWFNNDSWLTFNMVQVGRNRTDMIAPQIRADSRLGKQTGLGEASYEGAVPLEEIRGNAYRAYLAGASYYAYGGNGCCGESYANINAPGENQVIIARNLMAQRSWLNYTADESFVVGWSGDKTAAIKENSAAMVYLGSSGSRVTIDMGRISASTTVTVQRFNPVDGSMSTLGQYSSSGTQSFDTGGLADAVLLLDSGSGNNSGQAARFPPNAPFGLRLLSR
jgi:hypothetical protein